MNCQEFARILDDRDLDHLPAAMREAAEVHLAACPQCARDQEVHRRLNLLPIPALSTERIAGWRAAALSGARVGGAQRRRVRFVVIGVLLAVAAAAALFAGRREYVKTPPVAAQDGRELLAAAGHSNAPESAPESSWKGNSAVTNVAADLQADSFTVLLMPLQIETSHPVAQSLGEEYYTKLLAQLRSIPGLVLVNTNGQNDFEARTADFRLRVTSGYGRVTERFGAHEQWMQHLVAEARKKGLEDSYGQVLAFSINPDCGRISPADLANFRACTPAGMVDLGIQQLRRNVFPPDPFAARHLQARFLDTSLPQDVRRQALAELIELRQKVPVAMDAALIRAIIDDAIANAPYPAQRAALWRAMRGQASALMVQPMIASLRREGDDTVRLELVDTLGAEFSTDPAARAELELIARRDASMLLRKVAERALSADSSWRDYVVATVKDANLPAAQRFEPLRWMAETKATRPADTRMDKDLIAIARQLLDDGDAVALAEVLAQASRGSSRPISGALQIIMSSVQHPAVADFLVATADRQPDFSTFSLLGRHRADPRVEARLRDMAANHPDPNVRQLAAAQLINQ